MEGNDLILVLLETPASARERDFWSQEISLDLPALPVGVLGNTIICHSLLLWVLAGF